MDNQVSTRCAVCQLISGLVINIIMAVPSDAAQDDCQLIEVMTGQDCDIGWYWNGGRFIPAVSEAV